VRLTLFLLSGVLAAQTVAGRVYAPNTSNSEADLGTWRIARVLWVNNHRTFGEGTMNAAKARKLIGKTITLSRIGLLADPFTGAPADDPGFKRGVDIVDRMAALRLEQIPPNITLGLPKNVIVFTHSCCEFYLRSDGALITEADDGYWFEFRKVKTSQTPAAH
jgi:hypothetical protein